MSYRWLRTTALLAVPALLLTACPGDDAEDPATPPDVGEEPGDSDVAPEDIQFDVGVTEDPCPDAVNPDNGCIYLGVLSDLTVGPFAALAVPITDGMRDFWNRVNEQGGIAGFDVNIDEYTRDNEYNPEVHVTAYREIEPNVLALAQSLGTPPTLAALDFYKTDDVAAVAVTWWSGWEFEDVMLQSGYNYCIESMNAIDWAIENHGVETVQAVHYPGDYGGDSAEGVRIGAEANDLQLQEAIETLPNAVVGNQDAVVDGIIRADADLVVLATGPREMAEIVGKSAARGYQGRFIGSVPTFNHALLGTDAGPAIEAMANFMGPWGPWGYDSEAHRAMQDAVGEGNAPDNDGYTFGWIWSYPLLSVLQQAAGNGDLTRAGVRAAVQEVTVDYEGALPDKRYAGDSNETVVREAVVSRATTEAPLGLEVIADFFVGPTAEQFDFNGPCQALG